MESDNILDYCPMFLYKFLLGLIHFWIATFETIQVFYLYIWRWWYVSTKGLNLWRQMETLVNDSCKLKKVPKHMGMLFTEKNDMESNFVSNLVAWAISFGVSYVSLYDREGHLLSYKDDIQKSILSKLKRLLGERYVNYSLIFKDSSRSYDNRYVQTKGVCVQILSGDDGMQDVVNGTEKIIHQVIRKELHVKDINATLVNDSLKATKGLPDPDLAIQFGRTVGLNGFLPWQSRLTEFISFASCRNISYAEFLKALKFYGDTKQRFGK